jgi:hypothetical protein
MERMYVSGAEDSAKKADCTEAYCVRTQIENLFHELLRRSLVVNLYGPASVADTEE